MSYAEDTRRSADQVAETRPEIEIAKNLGFQAGASEQSNVGQSSAGQAIFTLAELDKNNMALAPIDPDWIVEGNPEARHKNLSMIGNHWTVVDHWSCTAGKFRWHYTFDETILILEGEAFIQDDNGVRYHAVPGTTLTFPYGTSANWHVPTYIRKIAFNQRKVPTYLHKFCRAANKLHRKLFS